MRSKLNVSLLTISLAMTAGGMPQGPEADQLAGFMERARQDMTGIRDSTCLETIERGRRRPPHNDFAPVDRIQLEVSTVAGKEIFAPPGGRFDDRDIQTLIRNGTIGSGMFSTLVQNLFVKHMGRLRYVRQENLDGRRLMRFDFRAMRQESGFKLQIANISEIVAAKGSLWFDPLSLDLVRLEIHGEDIPYDLHLDDAFVRVDYARTRIGDSQLLLPKRSEFVLTYISGDADRNVINFSQCREYRSQSVIDFGTGPNRPSPLPGQEPQVKAVPEPAPSPPSSPSAVPPAPLIGTPPGSATPVPVNMPPTTTAIQSPVAQAPQAEPDVATALPSTPAPEITPPLPVPSFKSEVNLVTVPVVVRDNHGNSVGNFGKEDFRLFDDNRKQQITHFGVQQSAVTLSRAAGQIGPSAGRQPPEGQVSVPAVRLVAYVFDDVNIKFEDLAYVRDAAWRNISESLGPGDRVAVVATSGRTMLDFTSDRDRIHDTLFQLRPNSIYRPKGPQCPDLNFYQAYAIASGMAGGVNPNPNSKGRASNLPISPVLKVAIEDLENCNPMFDPRTGKPDPVRENMEVEAAATQVVTWREREIDVVFNLLKMLSHRMASMSGQRSIILASPGFLVTDSLRPHEMNLIDEAIRSGVVISALDAMGLWTANPAGEIDESIPPGAPNPHVNEERVPFRKAEIEGGAQALDVLAQGTGGKFIDNSNDFLGAYRQLANQPEFIYDLGFTPQGVKSNGAFHRLAVKLARSGRYDLQARSGYFDAKPTDEKVSETATEIRDAVFSQLEIRTLPVNLQATVDHSDAGNAKVTVTVGLDRNHLSFDNQQLTAVVALFDDNGSFIGGNQGILDLKVHPESSNPGDQAPLTLKTAFSVKPGSYRVRLVIHDQQAQILEARNQTVAVP